MCNKLIFVLLGYFLGLIILEIAKKIKLRIEHKKYMKNFLVNISVKEQNGKMKNYVVPFSNKDEFKKIEKEIKQLF